MQRRRREERPAANEVSVEPPPDPDPLDEVLSLVEAAQLSGLAAHTLTQQAEKGRLHARKVGHTWITTRYWLDIYLATHARRRH